MTYTKSTRVVQALANFNQWRDLVPDLRSMRRVELEGGGVSTVSPFMIASAEAHRDAALATLKQAHTDEIADRLRAAGRELSGPDYFALVDRLNNLLSESL